MTQSRLSDVSAKSDVQELIQNIPRRPLVVDYIVVQKSFCEFSCHLNDWYSPSVSLELLHKKLKSEVDEAPCVGVTTPATGIESCTACTTEKELMSSYYLRNC